MTAFNVSVRGTGPAGTAGAGVPAGGTAGQYLTKVDGTNYNTQWSTLLQDVRFGAGASRASNLSVNSGVVTDVTWPTEDWDTNAMFTPGNATITCTVAGVYVISAFTSWATAPTGLAGYLIINGSTVGWNSGGSGYVSLTTSAALVVNDVVKLQVIHSAGVAQTLQFGYLRVSRISA